MPAAFSPPAPLAFRPRPGPILQARHGARSSADPGPDGGGGAPIPRTAGPGGLILRVANPHATRRSALLAHDFLTDARLFASLMASPLLADTLLIALDMRGHGASPHPTGPYSHASDILAVANAHALAGAPVHFVGAGTGAVACLEASLRPGGGVASVAALTPALPGHRWRQEDFLDISAARRAETAVADVASDRSETARWIRAFLTPNAAWQATLENADASVVASLRDMVRDYRGYHFLQQDVEEVDPLPLRERLENVQPPVLSVVGENETRDFQNIAQTVFERVKRPASHSPLIVPGCFHFPVLENPDAVAGMLKDFWDSLEGDPDDPVDRNAGAQKPMGSLPQNI